MCSHGDYIEDYTSGDVVCLICGLVLDKIFLRVDKKDLDFSDQRQDKTISKKLKEKDLSDNLINFLHSTNIHLSYYDEILRNATTLLSNFTYFRLPLIIASACFVTLSKTEYPITLSKLENFVCENKRDKKNFFKMVVSLQEPSIFPNLSSHVANHMLQGLDLNFHDIESIKKNLTQLKCEYCTYSPLTEVAGHTILYLKSKNNINSLSKICFHVGVSKTSVYSFINSQRHKCVQTWSNVYNQLSPRYKDVQNFDFQ